MEKALQAVQGQQQSINATLQNMSAPAGSTPGPGAPTTGDQPTPQPAPIADASKPSGDIPFPLTQGPPQGPQPLAPSAAGAPAVASLYSAALRDYMAAKYALATSEFEQVATTYPSDSLAGNAFYYMGEIDYREGKFAAAIKDYDHVLDQYPSNPKIPVSHLHKGQALLSLKQRDAGINELRALIQRFPTSPEAAQARTKLNGMGVPVAVKRPS
jgi:tol-pal system protein YbgF